MFKKYIWLLLSPLFWTACHTGDFPPDMPDEPVFTTQFTLDAATHALQAGVENKYLYTSFKTLSPEMLVLSGAFAEAGCAAATCPGSLSFEFRNDHFGADVMPDTLLAPGMRSYFLQQSASSDIIRRVTFFTPDTLDFQTFQWKIDNGDPQSGNSIVRDFDTDTAHVVQLRASRNGAIKSLVSRSIRPDTVSGDVLPKVGITVSDSMQGGGYLLSANTFGVPVSSYYWNTLETTPQIIALITDNNYSLRVTNPAGDTAFAQIFKIDPAVHHTANFSFQVQNIIPPVDTVQLKSVNIRWVAEDGGVWESQRAGQSTDAYFQILSAEPYDPNENGQKTYKISIAFRCQVYNILNTSLHQTLEGTAVIAVAYP
jgi:hypothetical protein